MNEHAHITTKSEMAQDIAVFDAAMARAEESFPLPLFDAIDAGASPVVVFRERRKMKQFALAAETGLSAAYLNQIEKGTRKGTVKALKAIADALNVPLDLLT